jgi:uncharacterized OB-fold protein
VPSATAWKIGRSDAVQSRRDAALSLDGIAGAWKMPPERPLQSADREVDVAAPSQPSDANEKAAAKSAATMSAAAVSAASLSAKPRALPVPTPETRHFWDGTRRGELLLQCCDACAHTYFPPRPFCPRCASRQVSLRRASGRATLYSYVIHHRPAPGFTPPYAIAVVTLAEGPRMMTNIVDCPQTPEALVLDMPLEVAFTPASDEITLPLFRPARS